MKFFLAIAFLSVSSSFSIDKIEERANHIKKLISAFNNESTDGNDGKKLTPEQIRRIHELCHANSVEESQWQNKAEDRNKENPTAAEVDKEWCIALLMLVGISHNNLVLFESESSEEKQLNSTLKNEVSNLRSELRSLSSEVSSLRSKLYNGYAGEINQLKWRISSLESRR